MRKLLKATPFIAILLFGFFFDKKVTYPDGFKAVIPSRLTHPGCPNLIDAYQLSSKQEHRHFLQDTPQNNFQYFVIESEIGGGSDYKFKLLTNQTGDAPSEHKGQLHSHKCAGGWAKVQEKYQRVWDEKSGRDVVHQHDIWFARDEQGNLLIHTVTYREKPGWTFWAAGGVGGRLIRINDQWSKISKASEVTVVTQPAQEISPPKIEKQVSDVSECPNPSLVALDFNQRLIDKNVTIDSFSIQPPSLKDNRCVPSFITLGFISASITEGQKIITFLQQDPNVDRVEILETRMMDKNVHFVLEIQLKL